MSSYTSILEDAITALSLDVRNQIIIDDVSYPSNITLLFFIDYSMYKERLQTVLGESSNYQIQETVL